jgi:uncharacterized protein YneF (UPF0154 family)
MNTAIVILLIGSYISIFLLGRIVGALEAKEVIMKILKDNKVI